MNRFESYSKRLKWLIPFLLTAFVAGCGGGSDSGSGVPGLQGGAAPVVTSTTPVNTATGVSSNSTVTATFSKAMAASMINTTTFTVTGPGATAVTGIVTLDAASNTATFAPTSNLAANTNYTVMLTTGAQDVGGVPLASNFAWTFTTGATVDTTAPTVLSTTPATAATDVSIDKKTTVVFSEAMNPATINTATFTLTGPGTTPVSGAVTYTAAGTAATFAPASNLAANTTFTATITTGAKDLAGNALASNKVWIFTTGATPDTTAPTVSSTSPVGAAIGVAIDGNITATFSEAMDPATITATTVTLSQGTTPIAGAVTYAGTTATFNPTNNLAPNTTYTATVTTGAKDQAGNALAGALAWRFTTAATPTPVVIPAAGPAPVALGSAGNFVVLAKSKVSTTGTTSVVGNIGLSPAAETFITGFSQARDATNVFSTSSIVTGRIYAADMAPPTPSNMTSTIADMETAYTDAAGRTLPDFTELGAGDISGKTLAPGLYKWGTGVLIASGITLSGGANDVWIFQIAQDLTLSNGVIVTLSGGAQPMNIFWQVAGQATLGTTSDFKGIILSKTQIVLQTGARMNGRALAQTAVTLDANAVTQPAP